MEAFPCTGCGLCCERVGKLSGDEVFALDGGRCKHLQPDSSCGIYETRPEVCRISKRAEKSRLKTSTYFRYFAAVCNRLQEQQDAPVKFRVKI